MTQRVGADRPRASGKRRGKPIALAVPPRVRLRVTPDDFWRLCQANRDLRLERTAKGVLVVMPPAGSESGRRNASISAQLWVWNEQTGLGVVFDSSAGFTLPNTAVRGPDTTWMTRERWDALPREDREKFAHVCPDFVAELRSKSDEMKPLRDKMREYNAQGVRLGWLIDPKTGTVEVYRPGQPVEVLKRPAALNGENVLPGFVLDLKGILFD
jgi:Uma2 family endonuclease